jgi:hypothetical protein
MALASTIVSQWHTLAVVGTEWSSLNECCHLVLVAPVARQRENRPINKRPVCRPGKSDPNPRFVPGRLAAASGRLGDQANEQASEQQDLWPESNQRHSSFHGQQDGANLVICSLGDDGAAASLPLYRSRFRRELEQKSAERARGPHTTRAIADANRRLTHNDNRTPRARLDVGEGAVGPSVNEPRRRPDWISACVRRNVG